MLVELSVMEQRYQAVLAVVQDGWQVSEVARRLGVSRQSVPAAEAAWMEPCCSQLWPCRGTARSGHLRSKS